MRTVELALLTTWYASYNGLFFTDKGVIAQEPQYHPFMQVGPTIKKLLLDVKTAYLDGDILLMYCESDLTLEQMSYSGHHIINVKNFLPLIDTDTVKTQFVRALHWMDWDQRTRYCSRCGSRLTKVIDSAEKKCSPCELSVFPKLSPAVLVVIQRKNEILLARSPHFRPGIYSGLAGFIDLGESAEAAVHREVQEEVGLEITDLTYFGSQSWPFPDSFMIVFTARYMRGEITIDPSEIEDAQWFNVRHLPELPASTSIARKVIDHIVKGR